MALTFYNSKVVAKLLVLQLVIVVISSFVLGALKGTEWGFSALAGGAAAWLPAALFLLFFRKKQMGVSASKIVWRFAVGEAIKIVITGIMLFVALGVFDAVLFPVILNYLLILLVQIMAPVMVKTHCNQ
ncbi:MAG: ATP synthase subunit I [Enterobacteriaceae bacterium]